MQTCNPLNLLVLGIPSRGHTFPTIQLIKSLKQQGCKLTYLNTDPFKEIIESSGATFINYNSATLSNISIPITTMEPHNVTIELQKIFFTCALEIMPTLDLLHRENNYHAVIYDQMALWGHLFSDKYTLPSFCSNTMFLFDNQEILNQIQRYTKNLDHEYYKSLNRLTQKFPKIGSYKDVLDIQTAAKADYIITYYPAALHKPSTKFDSNKIISLGNRFNSENFQSTQELTDSSLIYISFGTVFNDKPYLLEKIINYFLNTEHKLIVSTGYNDSVYKSLIKSKAYKNIEIYNFVNQLEVLSKSTLFITHAGFNSIYEGLYCSVPMLMLPHIPEQRFNAEKIERLKSGYLLEESKISHEYLSIVMHKTKKNWHILKQASKKNSDSFINSNDNDVVAKKILMHIYDISKTK